MKKSGERNRSSNLSGCRPGIRPRRRVTDDKESVTQFFRLGLTDKQVAEVCKYVQISPPIDDNVDKRRLKEWRRKALIKFNDNGREQPNVEGFSDHSFADSVSFREIGLLAMVNNHENDGGVCSDDDELEGTSSLLLDSGSEVQHKQLRGEEQTAADGVFDDVSTTTKTPMNGDKNESFLDSSEKANAANISEIPNERSNDIPDDISKGIEASSIGKVVQESGCGSQPEGQSEINRYTNGKKNESLLDRNEIAKNISETTKETSNDTQDYISRATKVSSSGNVDKDSQSGSRFEGRTEHQSTVRDNESCAKPNPDTRNTNNYTKLGQRKRRKKDMSKWNLEN